VNNWGVDLKDGHLVTGDDKLHLPRYELLFGSLQSQKSKHVLDLHRKYKQRLMHPLQINNKLRLLNELDFLVPEKDFLTWVQFSGLEANPQIEKLMEQVKSITDFSKKAFKGKFNQEKGSKQSAKKEDVLRENLEPELYQKIKLIKKKSLSKDFSNQESINSFRGTITELDEACNEKGGVKEGINNQTRTQDEDTEIVAKQLSMINAENKSLKQLKNNVHFRYTNRKLLLLRSLNSLSSKDKIVKTFFQKTENNFLEKEEEFREKLKQKVSNDVRLILTHKKDFSSMQIKLRNKTAQVKKEANPPRNPLIACFKAQKTSSPSIETQQMTDADENNNYTRRTTLSECPIAFAGSLQHLDDVGSLNRIDTDLSELNYKDAKFQRQRLRSDGNLTKGNVGIITYGNFGKQLLRTQSMGRFFRQSENSTASYEQRSRGSRITASHVRSQSSLTGARKLSACILDTSSEPFSREDVANQTGKTYRMASTGGFSKKISVRQPSRSSLAEIANKINERNYSKPAAYTQSTARLDTAPGSLASCDENPKPQNSARELGKQTMYKVQKDLRLKGSIGSIGSIPAWSRVFESMNTLEDIDSQRHLEEQTEAILNSYGYRDTFAEEKRNLVSKKIRSRSSSSFGGKLPREMIEKTEKTLKEMLLRKRNDEVE